MVTLGCPSIPTHGWPGRVCGLSAMTGTGPVCLKGLRYGFLFWCLHSSLSSPLGKQEPLGWRCEANAHSSSTLVLLCLLWCALFGSPTPRIW